MSTSNEGSQTNDEGQKSDVNLEELQSQLSELSSQLETERSSKARILDESKKYREGFLEFKKEKDSLAQQKADEEEARLKKEGQFSVLLEQREARIKELEETVGAKDGEVNSLSSAISNFKKASAFERALGGKIKREEYWDHVDFESIAVNPETNQIDGHSLRKAVDSFTDNYKELVDFGNAANLPNGTPAGGSGKLTYEQWQKLPSTAEKKKRMKDVMK